MDLPGEKLLIKLWETIAEKGIGALLSPWQTRREGIAHAEVRQRELLLLAQAEVDAADVRAGKKRLLEDGRLITLRPGQSIEAVDNQVPDTRVEPVLSLEMLTDRGLQNLAADEARKEIGVSRAIIYAEEALAEDTQVPPERKVDDDWLHAWRENAGRVSSQDLQRLWGSVLAGEVKSPGTYSIRTLDFLRTLSRKEAEQISMLATFALEGRIIRSEKAYLEAKGVTFDLLLRMQQLGVVSGVEGVGLSTSFRTQTEGAYMRALRSHGKAVIVKNEDPSKELKLEVYLLTEVGGQILGLGQFSPDLEYLRQVGKRVAAMGFEVQLADWKQISETEGMYFNEAAVDA